MVGKIFATVFIFAITFFLWLSSVEALELRDKSDALSRLKTGIGADHTIQYTSSGGVLSGTIQINFGSAVSSMGGIDYTDIDLLYGMPGAEVQAALWSASGTNVWGVAVDEQAKTLTLSYPVANGTPITTGQRVIIRIGTHATNGVSATKTQWRQLINGNPVLNGNIIEIRAGNDTGRLAVPIIEEDSVGILCISEVAAPSDLRVEMQSGTAIKLTWTDNAINESGFFIERSELRQVAIGDTVTEQASPYSSILNIRGTDLTTGTDTQVTLGGKYQYRVRAYNICGLSAYSPSAVIQTNPGTISITISTPIPVVPPAAPIPAPVIEITPTETKSAPAPAIEEIKPPPTPSAQQPGPTEERPAPVAAPANVSGISVSPTYDSAMFSWQLPPQANIEAIQVQRSEAAFPRSLTEGQTVFRGLASVFTDTRLSSGTVYYYTFFTVGQGGLISSGSFIAAAVRSLPPPSPSPQESQSSSVLKPPAEKPPPSIAPSFTSSTPIPEGALAPSPISGFGATVVDVSESAVPAVIVSLPAAETIKEIAPSESQRASVVLDDSKGGSSAFTIDIPKDTITEEAEVSIAPITTAQANIIDSSLSIPLGHEAVGNTVYRIQVRKSSGERIKNFDIPLRITLSYDPSLIQTVDEKSLKIYYWESAKELWMPLRSFVDTESKVVIAEVEHTTLFSVLGKQRTDISREERKKTLVASVSQTIIKRPISYVLRPEDLGITLVQDNDSTWSLIRSYESSFYATPFSLMHLCVPTAFFGENTESIMVSVTNLAARDDYFLARDEVRRCYTATITTPPALGEYSLILKTIDADEFARTHVFKLIIAHPHEILIVPFVTMIGDAFGTPLIALLLLLLVLIIVGFVFYDVYRKVIKRKFGRTKGM